MTILVLTKPRTTAPDSIEMWTRKEVVPFATQFPVSAQLIRPVGIAAAPIEYSILRIPCMSMYVCM